VKKKKILFFDHVSQLSGGERSLLLILKELSREYFEPILVTPHKGSFTDAVEKVGVKTELVSFPRSILEKKRKETGIIFLVISFLSCIPGVLRLVSLIKRRGIRVVYTNSQKAHLIGLFAGLLSRIPVIWHFRDILKEGPVKRVVRFFAVQFVSQVIAISHSVSEQFYFLGRKRSKVNVVYNAIDIEEFVKRILKTQVDLRGEFSIPQDSILVASIGQIAQWKGQEYLIYLAKDLGEEYKNVFFFIIGESLFGEDEYKERLLSMVRKANLRERVFFTGFRSDIEGVMSNIDILLHTPTEPEPFGRVLIEAMAAGTPVVTFDRGAAREIIEGGTGILVPPCDREMLKRTVSSLLEDAEVRNRLITRARAYVKERFSSSSLIQNIEKILRSV
jgi:glycosyltransferase involved in cell wall biosynthesis